MGDRQVPQKTLGLKAYIEANDGVGDLGNSRKLVRSVNPIPESNSKKETTTCLLQNFECIPESLKTKRNRIPQGFCLLLILHPHLLPRNFLLVLQFLRKRRDGDDHMLPLL